MRLGGILCGAALMAAWGQPVRAEEAASRIMALPAGELAALVEREDATTFERATAIARLGIVGGEDATRVLAAQLGNEELNAYARSALEAIGDAAADAALREAAGKLSGRPLVGVLNSLGQRRDEQAVGVLEGHLKSDDAEVRAAAAVALGAIGSEQAAAALLAALASSQANDTALGDACLRCAERLAHTAPGVAPKIYDRLLASPTANPVQAAALLGGIRLLPKDAARLIEEQLEQADADRFHVALTAAREIRRSDVTEALMRAMPKLAPERQALVLRALGEREGTLPIAWLVERTSSEAADVRAAAVDVMAAKGGPEAARQLVDVAFGVGAAAPLALERLKTVEIAEVDQAVADKAAEPTLRTNVALIELAGARRIGQLKPLIRELASHEDTAVRRAAIVSLGQVGDLSDLDMLVVRALGDGDQGDVDAARSALRMAALRLDDREACAGRIAKEMDKASPDKREYLLRLLREMGAGCDTALATVVAAATSSDAALKEAGTRELGAWPTATAGEALLNLAKNDAQEKYQIRALRGYIRIARQLQLSDEERLQFFHTALEVAQRDEERRLALGILERIPSVATLELATGYLDQPAMASAAGETAVNIAAKLILSEPAAVAAAMGKVKAAKGVELAPEKAQLADALLQRAGGAP